MDFNSPHFSKLALERFDYHLAHPNISPDAYRASKRRTLNLEVRSQHRIYLDTKFWIKFGDTVRGRANNKSDIDLLTVLRRLKSNQKAICPLSYSSIKELWLQTDSASRRATAEIMDELSAAVCIQPPHILFEMELWHLLYSTMVSGPGKPFSEVDVWTKAGYYLGEPTFRSEALPDHIAQVIQKCLDDSLFDSSLGDIVEALSKGQRPPTTDREKLANELTSGKNQNPEPSFSELYRQEIVGGLEAHHDSCCKIMAELCKVTGLTGDPNPADRNTGGRMVRGLIESALKAGKVQARFPQLHINASLHAALRWDNRRTYKRGDCEDFGHAGSALPYCDYFLTEKSLSHLICSKPLELDIEYGTNVFFESESTIRKLSQLL